MRRLIRLTQSSLCLSLLISLATPALGQTYRDSLAAGNAAYDRADFATAARQLAIGLDPAAGPRDAAWVTGLHKLVDALLQTGDSNLVPLYLAWAHRVAPAFTIDTLLFPPRVTTVIRQARTALVRGDTALVTTTWEFSGGDRAARRGMLRVGRAPGLSFAVIGRPRGGDSGLANLGTVLADERRTLTSGVYTVTITVEGQPPITVSREVLPGVTTIVTPRPRAATAAASAEARSDTSATLEARLGAGGAVSCLAGTPAALCWGTNANGMLGAGWTDSTRAPAVVAGGQRFRLISVGGTHACGLTAAGAAFCWGANVVGQLGNGANAPSATPVAVSGTMPFTTLASGAQHTCAISRSGAVFCWGAGAVGQLGNRATANSNQPVAVNIPPNTTFTALAAGGNHTCALTSRGALWCWGAGTSGQLGAGNANNAATPVAVAGDLTFREVAAGSQHTCAADAAGRVHCWGANTNGQLGNNTTTSAVRPGPISDSTAFTALTAGEAFTCGLTDAGAVWCWGEGTSGQLGTGRMADSPRPALVVGGQNMRAIAAGAAHVCAVTQQRQVWCWGRNDGGQLGTLAGRTSAVPLPVLSRPAQRRPASGVARRTVYDNFDDGNLTAGVAWERDSMPGAVVRVDSGALVVGRTGARGSFGAAGVAVPVSISARDAALRFDVRVVSNETPACGLNCSAWPAMVRVRVKNRDFTEAEVWYVFGPAAAQRGWSASGVTIVPVEAAPGQWLRRQRFVIQDVATRADSIVEITFGGIGTDFEARFDNVVFPAPNLAAVVITPDSARLSVRGDSTRFTAEARDAAGTAQPWATLTWSSSDTTVARVSPTGIVTAVGNGVAQIRAMAETFADSARVTVRVAPAPRRPRR